MSILFLNSILKITVWLSLLIQIITAFVDIYVLRINIPESMKLIKQLVIFELIVQIIEGIFYIWLAYSLLSISNITPHRYYDWFFTTPTMLITFSIYLIYLKNKERKDLDEKKNHDENKDHDEKKENKDEDSYMSIIKKYKNYLIPIIFLNAIMLLCGYLGEIHILKSNTAVLLGFIPFIIYFMIIYEKFARYSENGKKIFYYFFIIWSLYGFAALMPYHYKNISYNILDLFAKNFFGLYLAFILILKKS
jgi:hypothetical protein